MSKGVNVLVSCSVIISYLHSDHCLHTPVAFFDRVGLRVVWRHGEDAMLLQDPLNWALLNSVPLCVRM